MQATEIFMSKKRSVLYVVVSFLMIHDGLASVCASWMSGARYGGDGMCYWFNNVTLTFDEATTNCSAAAQGGGSLAEFRTLLQWDTVAGLVSDAGVFAAVGASDRQKEGLFQWVSNNEEAILPNEWWLDNQPDNHLRSQDCVYMRPERLMDDKMCFNSTYSVCQFYIGNPCDTVLPGAEYQDGFCFYPVAKNMTMSRAQKKCAKLGAYLAEPKTANLIHFMKIFAQMHFDPNGSVMLGLVRSPPERGFRWLSDGTWARVNDWREFPRTFKFNNLGADNSTTTATAAEVAMMSGQTDWQWVVEEEEVIQAGFVCQKACEFIYLVALPDSALAGYDSALLSANHASSLTSWVNVKLTSHPGGHVETKTFYGGDGLLYRLDLDDHERSVIVVSSTQPIHLVLTLWSQDLSTVSSSLIFPLDSYIDPSTTLFSHAAAVRDVSFDVVSDGETQTEVTFALSGGTGASTFTLNGVDLATWPGVILSRQLSGQHRTMRVDTVHGYGRAAFVHADHTVAAFSTGRESQDDSADVTFDQVLPFTYVGRNYLTFPSLPMASDRLDTFTVVAATNGTVVMVPHIIDESDGGFTLAYQYVILEEAGETRDLQLPAKHFYHLSGSVPFYLYARLGTSSQVNSPSAAPPGGFCTVTLLPVRMWASLYTVHMAEPWTEMDDVYVAVVGEAAAMETVLLLTMDKRTTHKPMACTNATNTEYVGCYFKMAGLRGTYSVRTYKNGTPFAAYLFAHHGQAVSCHQLGADISDLGIRDYDADAYLNSVMTEEPEACPEPVPVTTGDRNTTLDYGATTMENIFSQSTAAPTDAPPTTAPITTDFDPPQTTAPATTAAPPAAPSTTPTPAPSSPPATTGIRKSSSNVLFSTSVDVTDFNAPDTSTASGDVSTAPPEVRTETATYDDVTTESADVTTEAPPPSPPPPSTPQALLPPNCPNVREAANVTLTPAEVEESVVAIQDALRVDKSSTSSSRRKKESTQDSRVSSVSMGLFSMTMVFVPLGLIVLMDLVHIFLVHDLSVCREICPRNRNQSPASRLE